MNFKLALVTGASSGIGEALCHLLASKGIDLVITGRNVNKLNEISQLLRSRVKVGVIALDIADDTQRQTLIEQIHAVKPDLVINNAGIGLYGDALSYETAEQMEILKVNGEAVLEITLESARTLFSAGKQGVILNVGSAAAYFTFPGFAVYAATKEFVKHVSESLDVEMKAFGIRVLVSCPGRVDTMFRMRAAKVEEKPEEEKYGLQSAMTASFAAQEIWDQIEKQKTVHIFDWRYRLMVGISKLIPKPFLSKKLAKQMEQLHFPRQWIKKV